MRVTGLPLGILVSLALAIASHAAEAIPDSIQKTLPAAPGGRLVIETDRGSITVTGRPGNEVSVEVLRTVKRGSEKKAAELLERHKVTIEESAGTIRVVSELPRTDRWSIWGPYLEVSIRVSVPKEFNLDAQTAGGSIRVTGVKGETSARTSGGSLRFEELAGKVFGRTAGGSIHGRDLAGSVDVTTSGGSVDLDGVKGGPLKAVTSGGSLRLIGIAAPVEARTSGGGIRLETSGTPVFASTSGGSVDATLTAVPTGNVELRSSAGGITLRAPADSAFRLDASTSAGGVRSDFPVAVTEAGNRSSLKGPVQGGGPLIKLRTSAGSIRIEKS